MTLGSTKQDLEICFNSCPEHIGRLFFHELRFEVTGIIPKFDS